MVVDLPSLPRFLFPLLLVFPPTGPLRDGPGHLVPILVTIFPVSVALRPVPPALPRLMAGGGGGGRHKFNVSMSIIEC